MYSNEAAGLYFVAGRYPVFDSPGARAYRSNAPSDELSRFRQVVRRSKRDIYLVWQIPNRQAQLLTPSDLRARGFQLLRVAETTSGRIYRVRASVR